MDQKDKIRFYAIENAVKFRGKANPGAVIGKILGENPDYKKDMASISKLVNQAVIDVNSMDFADQQKEFEKNAPKEKPKEKEQKKKELPELPDAVVGKVVTRIPPEPSKYNHIGHALSFLINYIYAEKYKGRCLLKLEDTNPEKCTKEFADAMIDDITNYLEIKPSAIIFISDDMGYMYGEAEKLIKMNKAYVCFCDREKMQDLRHKGMPCECRNNTPDKNMKLWKEMQAKKFKEGECTLRLTADMESENQVMRDPVIFRVSYAKHFRLGDKFCVWPLYDFENSVEDSKYGVTHVLRSSEFGDMRIELQSMIKDLLGLQKQVVVQYGRFNVAGATTKGREIRGMIEEGKISNWDDISLVTLRALKRRGIVKETYYELVNEVGISANTSKNIDWSMIESINRSILDKKVNRFFFINDPVEIKIEDAPELAPELKMHPEDSARGKRVFRTKDMFYITGDDHKKLKPGELVRLMDCLNFKVNANKFTFDSLEHSEFKERGKLIIHWLPVSDNLVGVEVRMPDNTIKTGLAEASVKNLKEGDIIQFTRFGFCRLDKIEKDKLIFWFTNK